MNKMTTSEFLSLMESRGAKITPPTTSASQAVKMANINLQEIRAAMLPSFLIDLYYSSFGITLGSACIFGPTEIDRGIKYPIPSIVDINKTISCNKNLFGKTVFGRNDLFWFATDALGKCFMLDNLTLATLRTYDDPFKAMNDCLIVGKI